MPLGRNMNRPVIIAVLVAILALSAYAIFTATSEKSVTPQSVADAAKTPEAPATTAPGTKAPDTAASGTKAPETKAADAGTAAKPAAAVDPLTRFDGKPYKIYPDRKVNFSTYRGYNMYSSICFVCHGPSALGSSFAPALVDSLKVLSYEDFVATVMNGRENITSVSNNVMPSFGTNPTVVKYIDSLYAYLKGRADGAIRPGEINFEGPKDE